MDESEVGAINVRDYLVGLLHFLWSAGTEFEDRWEHGRRLHDGRCDWRDPVYKALVVEELIEGSFDADGNLVAVDYEDASEDIQAAIRRMAP